LVVVIQGFDWTGKDLRSICFIGISAILYFVSNFAKGEGIQKKTNKQKKPFDVGE
jgi:hypothetical protein